MAETTYTYSIQNDFPNQSVDLTALQAEIEADATITVPVVGLNTDGDDCNITFQDALDPTEKTALDTVVGNHTGEPLIDTPIRANAQGEQDNTTSTWDPAVTLTPSSGLKGGTWQVTWYSEIKVATDDGTSGIFARVALDGTERAFSSSGSDQYQSYSGSALLTFQDGDTPSLTLDFRRVGTANTAHIRRCQLALVLEEES